MTNKEAKRENGLITFPLSHIAQNMGEGSGHSHDVFVDLQTQTCFQSDANTGFAFILLIL